MVLEKLQIIIDADSRGALKELEKVGTTAQKELGKAETATQRTSAQLKSIGSATALGGLAIVGSLGALAKASDDADKQVAKLESSIQGSTNTFKNNGAELTDLAESLQQVTAADADAIIGTQSLLVQFGLTEDQVKTLTPLVVDLSRKMGVDLDTAAKAVSKAVDGSGGALKKMGINLDESKLAADGFGTTVDGLRQAVGGFAQQEGATFSGQLERLKNNLGDIGENVGKGAADVLGGLAGGAADAASALNEVNPGILEAAGGIGATIGVVATLGGGFATLASVALDFRRDVLDGKTELVKLGEDGERSLTKVGKAAAGIAVVGAIAGIIETVSTVANSINDIDKKTAAAFDGLRKNVNGTAADLGAAFSTLVEVEDKSAEFAGIWQGLGSEIQLGNFKADVEEVDKAFTTLLDTLGPEAAQKVIDNLQRQNEALDTNSDQYRINADFITESQKRIDERTKANLQAIVAERNQKRATQESVEQYDRETGTLEGVTKSLKDYQDRLKFLTSVYDAGSAAAKGFAEQIERSTVSDDKISAAISYNEAFQKFLDTAENLPGNLNAVQIAISGIGAEANTVGEEAVQAFLAVGDQARSLLSTFIQAGDEQGAIDLAARLREQIGNALAEGGMNPDQINTFLKLSGLTDVQIQAAIKFGNIEAELLRIQTLINLFQTQINDAPPELLLAIDQAFIDNDLQKAGDLIRDWVKTKSKDPATSQIAINTLIGKYPDLAGVISMGQTYADRNPVRVPVIADTGQAPFAPGEGAPGKPGKPYNPFGGTYAEGGDVRADMRYLVGERGPEMFVPKTDGTIIPNNVLTGKAVGQTMNLTQNIYSTDPMLTASEVVRKQRDAAFMAGV